MTFYYIIEDGKVIGRCGTKENAIDMIRCYQESEKKAHQWLHAEYSIIEGKQEEFIKYE